MKRIKIIFIVLFFVLLSVPVFSFNFKEHVESEIDNRMLAENPFGESYDAPAGERISDAVINYISDRIGFRDQMINIYTIVNDKMFGEMNHPSYEYGKNGYVFNNLYRSDDYGDYHEKFAHMVKEIQDYCVDRNTPFVFVFSPSKNTVLQKYLPEGVNYQVDWTKEFFAELDSLGVNYVDTTNLLKEKEEAGEQVFNKQYNAGHWNDLGAFYGVNEVLKNLREQGVNVKENSMDDFRIKQHLNKSLPTSKFKIREYEPIFEYVDESKVKYDKKQNMYAKELNLDFNHRYFSYAHNKSSDVDDTPKTLVMQGSYYNGMGYKFLESSLEEYIAVHNYQNVLNFERFFNVFKPECVIFEVAEYTFYDNYFSYDGMCNFDLNPTLSTFTSYKERNIALDASDYKMKRGGSITTLYFDNVDSEIEYGYLSVNGEIFDAEWCDEIGKWTVSFENRDLRRSDLKFIAVDKDTKTKLIYAH